MWASVKHINGSTLLGTTTRNILYALPPRYAVTSKFRMQRRTIGTDRVAQLYPQAPGSLSTTRRATVEVFQPASTRSVIRDEGKVVPVFN
jgi:hypothetical protein